MIPIIETFLGETTSELNSAFNTMLHPVKDRHHLTIVMQHMQNITKNALKHNLQSVKDTAQYSDGDLDSLDDEFKEINEHTQNVLTSSLITLLRQENILTDQVCNHSTIFDIAEVNKVCVDHTLTLNIDRDRAINA